MISDYQLSDKNRIAVKSLYWFFILVPIVTRIIEFNVNFILIKFEVVLIGYPIIFVIIVIALLFYLFNKKLRIAGKLFLYGIGVVFTFFISFILRISV